MTTLHDNEFTFNIDGLSEVSFSVQDYSISDGQPYKGVTTSGKTVTVKAGRHNSSDVADWFLDKTQGGGVIAKTFNDQKPSKLNFAVCGTLSLKINGVTYTVDDFVLAQGHFESNNNWWIGSKTMFGVSWDNVNQQYTEDLVRDTLSVAKDIISVEPDPVGAIFDSASLILDILGKRKVGSGSIAFRTSESTTAVELFLFQMDNSSTDASMTGSYWRP